MTKAIYDFGANNGDDIPYYLKKSDLVVAVEANPVLCAQIRDRFAVEITQGKLIVENCVVSTHSSAAVSFWIHKKNHIHSQFPRPGDQEVGQFEEVLLPSKSAVDLIKAHCEPHYVKIDIERFDAAILRSLFENGIRPPFISAESHTVEVFALLVAVGRYGAFNLVDGATVNKVYRSHPIKTASGIERYSFPFHSAGPFGDDLRDDWMGPDDFFKVLACEGLGWKDVHATTSIAPKADVPDRTVHHLLNELKRRSIYRLKKAVPEPVRQVLRRGH
jgi:FkbM family methyltransferase